MRNARFFEQGAELPDGSERNQLDAVAAFYQSAHQPEGGLFHAAEIGALDEIEDFQFKGLNAERATACGNDATASETWAFARRIFERGFAAVGKPGEGPRPPGSAANFLALGNLMPSSRPGQTASGLER